MLLWLFSKYLLTSWQIVTCDSEQRKRRLVTIINVFSGRCRHMRTCMSHINWTVVEIPDSSPSQRHPQSSSIKQLKATLCRNWHFVRFGAPHSFWVHHHCFKYKSQLCNDMKVLTTNKTHYVIKMLCVFKLCVEVNTYGTLWSDPLTEVT